ncbi:MAG: AAA family ATPase [Myxococcaceae bacterium]|nr:AAA family ATPase [Myxococcaceae bacterium]
MMRLEAVRLIHWYHFQHELLPINGSCLIFGDNGSGKSTVLDAIQLALVADQTEIRFNKAANEHSRRSLHGYVRHKLGSEDESRPGQLRFGRGACTSYVMLRFSDETGSRPPFVCGMVLEAGEEDTAVQKWGFVIPDVALEEVPALAPGEVVRTARDFRIQLRALPKAQSFPDVGTYRDDVRHRLGLLPPSFHRLLVKALDFKPIGQVRDFVFHYLLDERMVDTAALQANIEHYKRLEAEARAAERRIADLDAICAQGERILHKRRTAEAHEYLILRARQHLAEERAQETEAEIARIQLTRQQNDAELARLDKELAFLEREHERIIGLLQADPTYHQIQALEAEMERAREDLRRAEHSGLEARGLLERQTEFLSLLLSEGARDLRRKRQELFREDELVGASEEPALIQRLRETLARDGALAGRDLSTWSGRLDKAAETLGRAKLILEEQHRRARDEGRELEAERQELEKGRQTYDAGVAALLHLLRARLKGRRAPAPLCELIEVPNPRWRNAVEGYLNTRRFDILVDPEDFPRALSLYEKNKRGYDLPGRGSVFISGVGLVDIERLRERQPSSRPRALALQVETEDELARAYVDFVLGDVICCDDEQELRRHARAITDTVMVYQNFAARQTPPSVYSRPYIGQAARLRRKDAIEARLGELHQEFVSAAADMEWLKAALKRCQDARLGAAQLPRLVDEAEEAPTLRAQLAQLERRHSQLDRGALKQLEQDRLQIEADRKKRGEEQKEAQKRAGTLESDARGAAKRRQEAEEGLQQTRTALEATSIAQNAERRSEAEARYLQAHAERGAERIVTVFEHQRSIVIGEVHNLVQKMVELKTRFANDYGFAGETLGEGYAEHEAERERWRESRLPEYRERIAEAKRKATEQLAEDIIFRLRENLLLVQRQLNDLNHALKDVPFNGDRYQFTREVAPTHRPFYELIMAAGQFERDSLFGTQTLASEESRRTLQELVDRLLEGEAREVKTELEARADYREYFNYDIQITQPDGSKSSYDKVAGDKSGGETQTPYYIAILASMYRMYRAGALEGGPACGLVLLDEAFSKMDEQRIAAMLRFARNLGLQLVMATPKERVTLVAPWVERSLFIYKDLHSGEPSVSDFTKELSRDDGARAVGAA